MAATIVDLDSRHWVVLAPLALMSSLRTTNLLRTVLTVVVVVAVTKAPRGS